MEQATEKRLLRYLLAVKKPLSIGLLCLIIAVALELVGPFIAKTVIDQHILGVEGLWYEVKEQDEETVKHNNHFYKRADRLESDTVHQSSMTILQVDRHYYMIEGEVPLSGKRSAHNEQITIIASDDEQTFSGEKLSLAAIYPFFKPEQKPILRLLSLYIILIVIAGFFQYYQTYLLQKSSNKMIQNMRNDIFLHTQRVPMDYYVHTSAGSIVSRITNDTEAIRDLFERVLSMIVTSVIYMVGIFIALFILDAKLATLCLFVIPLIFGWMQLYKHYGTKYNTVIREMISKINGHINEMIQGMPIIQAFRQEKNVTKEFESLNANLFAYERKLVRLSALTSYNLVSFLRNLTFVGFIWYFGSASLDPESVLSIGLLYAFVDYITRLFEPVINIVNQLPLVEQARVASRRVFAFMDLEGEMVDHQSLSRYGGQVTFKNVSFAYDEKSYVLKDISFSINMGETVAFVGHTGSGKSTIMNLLLRFYDPQKGTILIDKKPITQWSRQQVRQHMGIVLQDPFIFSGTILSNVTMNDPKISREVAIKALKAVGGERLIQKLPHGYETKISEGGRTFSLGERQLISFARALAFDPAILILDEATANIDTETESYIQKGLRVLQKGRTTIVIAHRLSTIQHADSIIVLENGTIKERGNHKTLLEKKGLYYEMYQMQQGQMKIAEQLL